MTIVATFISQLRANAPIFGGRVAGAAEFYAGLKNYNTSLALPAAYVIPLGQDADANQVWTGLIQIVHKSIGVAVELDAQQDRRGQAPTMNFEAIEAQIFASVLNLEIDECRQPRGTSFGGARYLDLDRARLFYQWEFNIDWQITDADGVQPVSVDINRIEVDYFKAPAEPGDFPAAVVMLPTGDPPYPPPTNGTWPDPATKESA